MTFRYALALGSNRRTRHGSPERTLAAAVTALAADGIAALAVSPVVRTEAVGPAGRAFANAAVVVETSLPPEALLARLKRIERGFGRRHGRRWGPRPLDLDILLWSDGRWPRCGASRALTIPHPSLAARAFVLDPLAAIAPGWRTPPFGLTVRMLRARLTRGRPRRRRA